MALANWAAEHTTANFAMTPESLTEWETLWERTEAQHAWLVASCRDRDEASSEGDGDGERIVGFAKTGPHRARAAYDWAAEVTVYLDEAYFGRGIGTALYERLVAIATAQGYVTLLAGITAGHIASEALHRKLGFTPVGVFHRVGWKFGAWHDVGYWEKQLHGDAEPSKVRAVGDVIGAFVDDLATST